MKEIRDMFTETAAGLDVESEARARYAHQR